MITIRNETEYPTAEVSAIVRRELSAVELREKGVLVVVRYTRQTKRRASASQNGDYWLNPYSGTAYEGLPYDMKPWPAGAQYAVKLRIADPYCGAFPMRRGAWRYGWDDIDSGDFPVFKCEDWQEALVQIAAHEARHVEDYASHRSSHGRHAELRCELHAAKRLDAYRQNGRRHTVSDTPVTENGSVKDELLVAVQQLDGVTVIDGANYATVKHGKQTLGYVNGKRKVRVDFPMRGGLRQNMIVASTSDVAKAVKEMETFIPALEREANPDPKPEPRKRKSRAKAAKEEVATS
jgi:hypothetical protein